MRGWRRRLSWLLLMFVALVYIAWRAQQGTAFEADLLRLLPETSNDSLSREASARVRELGMAHSLFLVGHRDGALARRGAAVFARELRLHPVFAQVLGELPEPAPDALLAVYAAHPGMLLADAERTVLRAGDAEAERELIARHWFSPVALRLDDDPLGTLARFAAERLVPARGAQWNEGWLSVQQDGRTHVLIDAKIAGSAFDSAAQAASLDAIARAEAAMRREVPEATLAWTGVLKFAADARERTAAELNWIALFDTLGVLALLYVALRRGQPLALMLGVIASALVGATALSLLVFEHVHLITYVFGATLIGIAGDYALHYLVLHAASGAHWDAHAAMRALRRPLGIALGTTVLAYLAICLTPFAGFRQMAVFCLFGLFCAWFTVVAVLPETLGPPVLAPPRGLTQFARLYAWCHAREWSAARLALVLLVLLAAMVPGWLQLSSDDDVHLLQAPSKQLLAEQQRIAALLQREQATQFLLVRAPDTETLLQREEALGEALQQVQRQGALAEFRAVSRVVPSMASQRADRELLAQSRREGALSQALAQLGAAELPPPAVEPAPLAPDEFLATPLGTPWRAQWLGQIDGQWASVVLLDGVRDRAPLAALERLPGVQFVDESAAISRLFGDFRNQAGVLVALAYALVFAWLWRGHGAAAALRRLLPTVLASGMCLALLGYLRLPINLFHGVALLLVLGVGVDYALFLADGEGHEPASLLAIVLSAATAMWAFGLLVFSHLPAVSGFGLTVLLGVGLALLFAPGVYLWRGAGR